MKIRTDCHNLKNGSLKNQGSTMIETLVAFVVLMIILAIISGIIVFCSKLRLRADDTSRAVTVFSAQMNNNDNKVTRQVEEGMAGFDINEDKNNNIKVTSYFTGKTVTKDPETGQVIGTSAPLPMFYLVTPESAEAGSADYGKDFLSLYNIEADSYTYISNTDENEQYLLPKALRFVYKNDH
jgi:hypothetical protein